MTKKAKVSFTPPEGLMTWLAESLHDVEFRPLPTMHHAGRAWLCVECRKVDATSSILVLERPDAKRVELFNDSDIEFASLKEVKDASN